MSVETPLDPVSETRQTRTFRKAQPLVRFTPQQVNRQNALMRCAWENLPSKEAVIAFLNTHSKELGGEPLTLAIASEEGLRSVERLLVQGSAPEGGTP